MIGLKSGTVKLSHHSRAWRQRYRREASRLHKLLGTSRYTLEHIGSTAVPGLDAKPIIDMAMKIPSLKQLTLWIRRFNHAGYTYKGEYGLPGRHFFVMGNPVTLHLHLVASGCSHWERWLLFRDYLRAHPAEARRYNSLKKALARKYAANRDAYTRSKTPLVNRMLKRAEKWQARGSITLRNQPPTRIRPESD